MPPTCDLLLEGGCVVTVDDDRRIVDPGTVAVSGNQRETIGSPSEFHNWKAARSIDCRGKVVAPGLVDSHTHLSQTLARGLGEGAPVRPWLEELIWPYSFALEREDVRAAVRLGAIEAARGGITCLVDNQNIPSDPETVLAVAEEIEAVGLRGAVGRGIFGPRTEVARRRGLPDRLFRHSSAEELDLTRGCIQARPPESLVTIWPAPVNLSFVDPELVARCAQLARETGTRWQSHFAEAERDDADHRAAYGRGPLEHLHEEGLLDDRASLAHAIWIDDWEMELLAASGAAVAHNPISNGYLASGTMPLRALLSRGVTVGLGTDGAACGHRQDLFECMRQAIYAQRLESLDAGAVACGTSLDMATRAGARLVGFAGGQLAPKRPADIIVVDATGAHFRPMLNSVVALVYSATASDVEYTIVAGRVVVDKGRCVTADEASSVEEAQRRAERLIARAGLERLRGVARPPAERPPPR